MLALYAPEMAADVLTVSGHVSHVQDSVERAAVYVYDSSGTELASAYAQVSVLGAFAARLRLNASGSHGGSQQLYIGASYPGAVAQGLLDYATLIPMDGAFSKVFTQAAASVAKRATLPLQVPTWIPQPVTVAAPKLPYLAVSGADKSFTYSLDVRRTPRPYAYGSRAIETDANPVFAQIQGVRFQDAAAAATRLRHHFDQILPALPAAPGAIALGRGLTGLAYGDRWHTIIWHEGLWTLVVRGPDGTQNLQNAHEIVRVLDHVRLPPTDGVVWVRHIAMQNAVTGSAIEIDAGYRLGRAVYTVGGLYTAGSLGGGRRPIVRILRLTASMRTWRATAPAS